MPVLPPDSGLELPAWNDSLVPINESLVFKCIGGKRLSTDFDSSSVQAKCVTQNQWEILGGTWPTCVESKIQVCLQERNVLHVPSCQNCLQLNIVQIHLPYHLGEKPQF